MGATAEYMREYRERTKEDRNRKAILRKEQNRADEIGEGAAELERTLVNRWFHGPASEGINNTANDIKILEGFVEEDLRKEGFLSEVPSGKYKCLHQSIKAF